MLGKFSTTELTSGLQGAYEGQQWTLMGLLFGLHSQLLYLLFHLSGVPSNHHHLLPRETQSPL